MVFGRTRIGFVIGAVAAVLWTFGIYHFAYTRGHNANTPEQAIIQAIQSRKALWGNGYTILSDKAAVAGGYFIVVETPTTSGKQYDVFFATIQSGHWVAQDLHANIAENNPSAPIVTVSQHAPDMIIGVTRPGVKVSAVVAYRAVGAAGNEIPFALVQIGHLPIWIYKFPSNTNIENKLTAYDENGNVLTS